MDFFKQTLDLLKKDDMLLLKPTSPASSKSSPISSSSSGAEQPSIQGANPTSTPPTMANGTKSPTTQFPNGSEVELLKLLEKQRQSKYLSLKQLI